MRMLAYVRVSTAEQATNGHGLNAQVTLIRGVCEQRGWTLRVIRDEGQSGKDLNRPGLQEALRKIADGDADGLIVSKLDRLSRSQLDFAVLMQWFLDAGAALVILQPEVDTSTPMGKAIAGVFAVFAELERELIAQRTRDGLAEARAAAGRNGRQFGRPSVGPGVALIIREWRDAGCSLGEICTRLNDQHVPTARGGQWSKSVVREALGYPRRKPKRKIAQLPDLGIRRSRHHVS